MEILSKLFNFTKDKTAMKTSVEISEEQFLAQFENCTFPAESLNHESLLKLSWILINKYGLEQAIQKNKEIKENYYITVLKSDKFNVTLTKAYTEILYHFMNQTKVSNFEKLLREFPRLRYDFKDLVKTHYGYNILKEHRKSEPEGFKPILFTF